MSGTQSGKTTMLKAVIGYYVDQDPAPILVVNPTLDLAEAFSKDRLAPMIRDTPCLTDKIADPKSRDSGNTLLHKVFAGGRLTLAGANSPASLGARPIRIVLCDEIDKYPPSAGPEGDPVSLAFKRTTTFWNRKHIVTSTPTVKGASRIELAYEESDQRRYYVPCPQCAEFQSLKWAGMSWPEGEPRAAAYSCEHCGAVITDADKPAMLRAGEWRPTAEFKGTAGFHLSELYSPWVSFGEIAISHVAAKKDTELFKVWVNTSLGEPWEEEGERFEHTVLSDRAEHYAEFDVPQPAIFLTAGVDVQGDRVEVGIKAWGTNDESWIIYYGEIYGETSVTTSSVWPELDVLLDRKYRKPGGGELRIAMLAIDSGFNTQAVYQYARKRPRRVMAAKGMSQTGKAVLGLPTLQDVDYGGHKIPNGVKLWPIGTDAAKRHIFNRLKKTEPGPGFMHFYSGLPDDYFQGLCSEKLITKFKRGIPYKEWVRCHARNEPLDVEVYAFAAAIRCGLGRMKEQPAAAVQAPNETPTPSAMIVHEVVQRRPLVYRERSSFVRNW